MSKPLHVLIVEDSADDAELLLLELQRNSLEPIHERVDNGEAMRDALRRQPWDVVISDYSMPDFNGFDALQIAHSHDVDLPFILVSGAIGEDIAVAAMKAGAHDYLMKSNLARLVPAIERELREAHVRRARRAAETELKAWHRELEARVQQRTAELNEAHREHRRLESEIARAIEREQLRLGQELHDGLGQQLAGVNYMLTSLNAKGSPALGQKIQKLQTLIQQCIEQTRHLAKGFYPVDMENCGLFVALEEFTRDGALPADIPCRVESDGNPAYAHLKGSAAIQLFRIAQEAVLNAVKHAKASRVIIRLATKDEQFHLTVRDDGVGIVSDPTRRSGMGLRIMQYRAETEGGTLSVDNDPAGGTIVSCSLPVTAFRTPAKSVALQTS